MPVFTRTTEHTFHYEYQVEASSMEEAEEKFANNEATLIGSQETFNNTDIDEVK